MKIQKLGRRLITFGLVLLVVRVVLVVAGKVPVLRRLPGDLIFRRGGVAVVAPLATMIVFSLVLTVFPNLLVRLFR